MARYCENSRSWKLYKIFLKEPTQYEMLAGERGGSALLHRDTIHGLWMKCRCSMIGWIDGETTCAVYSTDGHVLLLALRR